MLNSLVERDVLHMYPRQEVEIRTAVLEWVDHIVRHIRASARFNVHPSAPRKYKRQCSPSRMLGSYTHLGHLYRKCATQSLIKVHG